MNMRSGILPTLLAVLWCSLDAQAHVGDQNVFFEGLAGPYPVRVVIRTPGVIPGLAEISVRVLSNSVNEVTVLPMRWDSARKGAPPADFAAPVRGETNLFNAQLWFMRSGAQGVEVTIHGAAGTGKAIVPVNAIATRVLTMSPLFGWALGGMGFLLASLGVSIIGAAVRDSILPAGLKATRRRLWFARGMIGLSAITTVVVVWLGHLWWKLEAEDYRSNRLHRPLESTATVRRENGSTILRLERAVNPKRHNGPLVPEHGKLMHLFLISHPFADAFAHVHPVKRDWKTFEAVLPPLPAGEYQCYADVTYETGFTETLIANVTLASPSKEPWQPLDPDDSWNVVRPAGQSMLANRSSVSLNDGFAMSFLREVPIVPNRETHLKFKVSDATGQTAQLEHFMGMASHLILRRSDGTVFTHLHPGGSFSMASQILFEMRASGRAPLKVASTKGDPICRLPDFDPGMDKTLGRDEISFPYAFPQAGSYRLWVQVKVAGKVQTGVFDVEIAGIPTIEAATRKFGARQKSRD